MLTMPRRILPPTIVRYNEYQFGSLCDKLRYIPAVRGFIAYCRCRLRLSVRGKDDIVLIRAECADRSAQIQSQIAQETQYGFEWHFFDKRSKHAFVAKLAARVHSVAVYLHCDIATLVITIRDMALLLSGICSRNFADRLCSESHPNSPPKHNLEDNSRDRE